MIHIYSKKYFCITLFYLLYASLYLYRKLWHFSKSNNAFDKLCFHQFFVCVCVCEQARAIIRLVIVIAFWNGRVYQCGNTHNKSLVVSAIFTTISSQAITCVSHKVRSINFILWLIYCCGLVQNDVCVFHSGNNDAMEWTMRWEWTNKKNVWVKILSGKKIISGWLNFLYRWANILLW